MPSSCCWQSSKGGEEHLSKWAAETRTEPAWFLYLFSSKPKEKVDFLALIAQRRFLRSWVDKFFFFFFSLCCSEERSFLPLSLRAGVWAQLSLFLPFNTSWLLLRLVRQIQEVRGRVPCK